jgi:hypothetical protein
MVARPESLDKFKEIERYVNVIKLMKAIKGISYQIKMLIPQVRPARTYPISPWEMNHLPREIEQQAYKLILITRMCVTSHSQPLINAQHLMASKKLLFNNNK